MHQLDPLPLSGELQHMLTHDVAQPDAPLEARQKLHEIEAIAIERRSALEKKVAMADEFLSRLRDLSTPAHQDDAGEREV